MTRALSAKEEQAPLRCDRGHSEQRPSVRPPSPPIRVDNNFFAISSLPQLMSALAAVLAPFAAPALPLPLPLARQLGSLMRRREVWASPLPQSHDSAEYTYAADYGMARSAVPPKRP